MDPGKRNRRITIQAKTVSKGASGGQVETWNDLPGMPIWAARRDFSGSERRVTAAGGGEVSQARVEFDVRYRSGITTQMRVVMGGEYFNIQHVNNWAARNERLVLTCDTGVNRG